MRLYAHRDADGSPTLGVVQADGRIAPSGVTSLAAELRRDPDLAALRERAATTGGARSVAAADLRPLAALQPGKVICVGLNYRDHLAEGAGREAPAWPLLFAKFATAVIGDGEAIVRPEGTHALDLEVELGVVIGRPARRVAVERAMDHVAGYIVDNDVSARDWQGTKAALAEGQRGDGQWLRAKGSDTFLPMGPVFVSADELDPAAGLRLRSWRTPGPGRPGAGEAQPMQDGSTADLIFPIPELIAFISRHISLEPGDVISTGTPSGVGVFRDPPIFLEPGDRVRCEVEGIGSVENPVVDWTEDPRDG